MLKRFWGIFLIGCLTTLGCGVFPESCFELSPESRLPKWFTLPPNLPRSDATVEMCYYIGPAGRTARFVLSDGNGRKIAKASATLAGEQPLQRPTPQLGYTSGDPSYELATVNDASELIEHRKMEPIFYITDDPAVWSDLGIRR